MLIISMVHDITARKHAEEERKQSEERYRSLFENAVFGIFRSTPAGYFIDANPALCSMLGYDSVEQLLQKGSTFDVFHNASQRLALLEELDRHDRISPALTLSGSGEMESLLPYVSADAPCGIREERYPLSRCWLKTSPTG